MPGCFHGWQAFSDRIATAGAFACGALSFAGGASLLAGEGPAWIGWLFSLFGVIVMAALAWHRWARGEKNGGGPA